jgi:hypothetical protein
MRNKLRAGAMGHVATSNDMPSPAFKSGAARRRGAGRGSLDHHEQHASAETSEIGATRGMTTKETLPQGREDATLTATISELIALQRQRTFCIVSQSRCDRSVESFIAKLMGFSAEADAKERKAVFAKASAFRKEVEKGGEGQAARANQYCAALSPAVPLILLAATAREGWDAHRTQVEKRMAKLAQTLPGYDFVKAIAGFGDKGFAILIGETGDLSNYATKERVWKRLGLAVIEGERQGRRTNAEEAAKHGYSPKRRSEIWALADSLFKHQWRGAKEDAPAHPIGRYGEIYAARKAHTETREGWTPAHRDNDARRVMTKALVEDLWKAWRQVR